MIFVLAGAAAAAAVDMEEGEHSGWLAGWLRSGSSRRLSSKTEFSGAGDPPGRAPCTCPSPRPLFTPPPPHSELLEGGSCKAAGLTRFWLPSHAGLLLLKLKEAAEAAAPGSWDAGLASAECEAAKGSKNLKNFIFHGTNFLKFLGKS
jgi:hypothetical protein